jgi:hypothetical protein
MTKTRPVIILDWDRAKTEQGSYLKKEIGDGTFHKWGSDYEEFESGAGSYSTAIIEKADGSILNHPVELIKFTDELKEINADSVDAKRYRMLRFMHWSDGKMIVVENVSDLKIGIQTLSLNSLDEALDAEREK